MPELPEVQTIVDDLNKKIVGRKITGVWFDAPKLITLRISQGDGERSRTVKKPKARELEKRIKGLKIVEIKRRGKNILIYLNSNSKIQISDCLLLIHLKMTGHLLVGKWSIRKHPSEYKVQSLIKGALEEKINDYIHLIFYFDNGWQLALSDLRKFAKVLFGGKNEIEKSPDLAKIGPEPLGKNFKFSEFKSLINKEKGKIKQVLMDQEVIAGIGNIYSDEILWKAKIHPFKSAGELSVNELSGLYKAIKEILKKAVKLRGTSISDYRDTVGKPGAYAKQRFVYRREGELCRRCKTIIKRVKIGGRSACFCPQCQKKP